MTYGDVVGKRLYRVGGGGILESEFYFQMDRSYGAHI